jgi:hypothetical protein
VFYATRLDRLAALTQRHRIPATYFRREFPDAGGLMSYGTSVMDAYRQGWGLGLLWEPKLNEVPERYGDSKVDWICFFL